MFKRVFLFMLMLLSAGGCESNKKSLTDAEVERIAITQKIELVEASGGLVLMVGGETITSDEIILPIERFEPVAQIRDFEQFKGQVRGQLQDVVLDKVSNILLHQHAKREAGQNIDEALEKAADNELRKFVLDYGGDQAKADEVLKQSGMDRKSFKERQKRSMLIQWYVSSKLPNNRPVTYRELMDTYNQMKDEFFAVAGTITFRLIDIQPARLEEAGPQEDPGKPARELAQELLAKIQSGEDFGELARQYSRGPRKEFGGLWRPVRPQSLTAPYDRLAAEAEKIRPGQIAIVVTPEHIFIMKLEEKQPEGYEPFEKVQRLVRNKIIVDRQNEVFRRLNTRLLEQAELSRTDEFIDFCLEKVYRMLNDGR
ncbi:MAG: peptidylprolyl isomerase [Planctomycetota bacterium]